MEIDCESLKPLNLEAPDFSSDPFNCTIKVDPEGFVLSITRDCVNITDQILPKEYRIKNVTFMTFGNGFCDIESQQVQINIDTLVARSLIPRITLAHECGHAHTAEVYRKLWQNVAVRHEVLGYEVIDEKTFTIKCSKSECADILLETIKAILDGEFEANDYARENLISILDIPPDLLEVANNILLLDKFYPLIIDLVYSIGNAQGDLPDDYTLAIPHPLEKDKVIHKSYGWLKLHLSDFEEQAEIIKSLVRSFGDSYYSQSQTN